MIRFSRITRVTPTIYFFSAIFIILINFSCASMDSPKSPDIENLVISEGRWEKTKKTLEPPTKLTQGASRFVDFSGILTAMGLKKGASIFAMVVFPILFPLMVLLGLALFVISVFGTSGVAAAGRRSELIANAGVVGGASGFTSGVPLGAYKQDEHGFPISLTSRDGLAFDALESDTCMERFVCEVLLHGGSSVIGKRNTIEILRGLNVRPLIAPNLSPGRKSRKVWKCSSLKCSWEKWIPWREDASATNGS